MQKEVVLGVAGVTGLACVLGTAWFCEMKFISVKKANAIIQHAFAENSGCFAVDEDHNYKLLHIEKKMPWQKKGAKNDGNA